MTDSLKPDLCVIGGGSAGLTAAAAARAFGASVVLIEKASMGGDCLNTGCVPSKALIAAARHAAMGAEAGKFGIGYPDPKIDFARVGAHIRDVIAGIAPNDSVERYTALGATVLREHARFVDKRTVEAGGVRIRARRFIVATGSRAAVPPISGIDSVPYLTNETVFDLADAPGHLIIVGGGPIGMELAQSYNRLGSRVTVIEAAVPMGRDDPELTAIALQRIEAEGVVLRTGAKVEAVGLVDRGIGVTISAGDVRETVSGTHLLIATGRRPNIEDLGLEAARINADRTGIAVSSGLRTSNRRVLAIGDVIAGGMQFTHVAGYHAGLAIRSTLFGLPARADRSIVPWATYTDPEIAQVGMTEKDARARYGDNFRILRWPYGENDRARTMRQTAGLIKLVTDNKGRILGCGIVGAEAGEQIALFAFAIANRLGARNLLSFIAPYPTLSELGKRVGVEFYRDKLTNPWIGRWMQLIRLLP